MIVYKATNLVNGKVYIGQTVNSLEYRKDQHFRETRSDKRKNTYFHNAIEKYGENNFEFEVIDTAKTIEELNEKEIYWIEAYGSTQKENGYNLDSGGTNCLKSSTTKQKISESKKELWRDPEVARRMKAGLTKGAETMKSRKGSSYVSIVCANCGAEVRLPKYEARRRKYCSAVCANSVNIKRATAKATEAIMSRHHDQAELVKKDIVKWACANRSIVETCPLNKISIFLEPMRKDIADKYGITDIRSIMACATGSYGKKLFLKWLQNQIQL